MTRPVLRLAPPSCWRAHAQGRRPACAVQRGVTGRRVSVDFYEARVQRMCQCARPSAVLFDPMRLVYTQTNSPALPE
jgi:hypothetical protein